MGASAIKFLDTENGFRVRRWALGGVGYEDSSNPDLRLMGKGFTFSQFPVSRSILAACTVMIFAVTTRFNMTP